MARGFLTLHRVDGWLIKRKTSGTEELLCRGWLPRDGKSFKAQAPSTAAMSWLFRMPLPHPRRLLTQAKDIFQIGSLTVATTAGNIYKAR